MVKSIHCVGRKALDLRGIDDALGTGASEPVIKRLETRQFSLIPMHIPKATYRIQLNPSFGFSAAKEIVSYLAEVGISDIYASPIFKARRGSPHGYDVVDPNELNPELGPASDFEELAGEVRNHRMGWLQDVVPNHMAFDRENKMLMDVLENGPNSRYFHFFDIDWEHPYESLRGRLLAPFLGSFYWEALERGEIKLKYGKSGFSIHYYHLVLPLRIETYVSILTHGLNILRGILGDDHPDFVQLLGILYALRTLPSDDDMHERYDQVRFVKRTLWDLYKKNSDIKAFIDGNLEAFNGHMKDPQSFKLLDRLLSEQLFRLSFWKVATEEINYRRFFNINELVCMRAEDPDIFERMHSLIFKLIEEGKMTGLRIDHIDGLYDPTDYLRRIREKASELYLTVEKILDSQEDLPSFWPVQGTTGYDFLNFLNGVFCQRNSRRLFSKTYSTFTGLQASYQDLVSEKKRLIMGKHMAGDIDNLAHLLKGLSSHNRHGSDITIYGLKRALVEVMALFPVYRTYRSQGASRKADDHYIKEAVRRASQSNPDLRNELQFIERLLLLAWTENLSKEKKDQWIRFVMRFQQFTGPLMAKGFEDTTLYVYNRLVSLNEVGGAPERFGVSLEDFHQFNAHRAKHWPLSMSASSTHDTKRGEDARARINVLSEIPKEWDKNLKIWSKINRTRKRRINGLQVPDRNDEYFLYQTMLGSWPFDQGEYPLFTDRIKEHVIKAIREAKVHTAWLEPDTEYEAAFISFVEGILEPTESNPFLKEWLPFQKKVAHFGIYNSLSQTLLKITAPGVPDFYQGTELWDFNLVDPDNRRPVDFKKRGQWLRAIRERARSDVLTLIHELLRTKEDGRIKLLLIYQLLKVRHVYAEVFQKGAYIPLEAAGALRDHIIGFARQYGRTWAVTITPRFFTAVIQEQEEPLGHETWRDTCVMLPGECPRLWKDMITYHSTRSDNILMVGNVLRYFPNSLLLSQENP